MSDSDKTSMNAAEQGTLLHRLTLAWVYIFPWPLCACSIAASFWITHSWPFVLYVVLLPIIYGYVAPGIATNLLHNWHFNGPFRMGKYFVHHGFMYAGNMAPLLCVAMLGETAESFSLERAVSVVLCTSALHGFVLWIHDIGIVRYGIVELFNRPAREERSAAEIVAYYAPLCFSLIGGGYAVGAVIAYRLLVMQHVAAGKGLAWSLTVGIVLTFTLPSLAYRWWCS